MQLRFTIADFEDRLKPRNTTWRPNFLVVGFNEWLDSRPLYLTAKQLALKKEYKLNASLPRSDDARFAMPALLCYFVITQQTDKGLQCEQRAAKAIIADCAALRPTKPDAPMRVELQNRLGEVVCAFNLHISEFRVEDRERKMLESQEASNAEALAVLAKVHADHMSEAQAQFERIFRYWHEGTQNQFVFQDFNILGPRPLCCFLDTRIQATNEAYWLHMYRLVMRLGKADRHERLDTPNLKTWSALTVREQLSVMVDMCIIGANNSTYLSDWVESTSGGRRGAEDFSTTGFNSSDCEDDADFIHYCFRTFRQGGPYKHYALAKMHKLAQRYECVLALSTVNRPSMGHEPSGKSLTAHMTTLFLHKAFLLGRLLPDADHKVQLGALRDAETKAGHMDTKTSGYEHEEELPMVLVGEGTGFLCPHGLAGKKPPKLTDCSKTRLYQSKDDNTVFLLYHLVGITNYFLDAGINIPTVGFSYATHFNPQLGFPEDGFVYGVLYSHMMAAHEFIQILPLTPLPNLKQTRALCTAAARNRLLFPPLWMSEDGRVPSRAMHKGVVLAPNLDDIELSVVLDEQRRTKMAMKENKFARDMAYNMLPPADFYQSRREFGEAMLGWDYVQLHGDLFVCIVYFSVGKLAKLGE